MWNYHYQIISLPFLHPWTMLKIQWYKVIITKSNLKSLLLSCSNLSKLIYLTDYDLLWILQYRIISISPFSFNWKKFLIDRLIRSIILLDLFDEMVKQPQSSISLHEYYGRIVRKLPERMSRRHDIFLKQDFRIVTGIIPHTVYCPILIIRQGNMKVWIFHFWKTINRLITKQSITGLRRIFRPRNWLFYHFYKVIGHCKGLSLVSMIIEFNCRA